ncbi:MAG: excinuclease ABC subunit UvrC [bacterium]
MNPERRPAPGSIPDEPGVYRFRDAGGRVIYVGKANSLRQRVGSYFADPASLATRTRTMVDTAQSVDWVVVGSEVEALQLEYSWIKEFDPRFNIRYRDDKSYPYLAVTMADEFPRALVTRGAKRRGSRYFGPYAHAWAIRETLDILLRVVPIRTCSAGVFQRAERSRRPCLLADIGKCSAPCVGRISPEEHRQLAEDLCAFLAGRGVGIRRRLEQQMQQAAADLDFERAARLRDDLGALDRAWERNSVVFDESLDADVLGLADDDLEAAVEVFHVRGGRIRGQRSFVVEKVEDAEPGEIMARLLPRLYEDAEDLPPALLVSHLPTGDAIAWLEGTRGGRVDVRAPQRGPKRELVETVTRNAEQRLALHKARRSGDLTARGVALEGLKDHLGLPEAPLRIEAVDISHLGGDDVVGSLVVFEDGLPRSREYRTFAISPEGSRDDTRAVAEVVRRRFRQGRDAREEGSGDEGAPTVRARPAPFAYPPQLLLIDGGLPQARSAARALREAGVSGVSVIGLAKRLEEVWVPDRPDPVILPRSSESLYLLQRIRDEAHRVALRLQRRRRSRPTRVSALESIPGLGPQRRSALLRHFGSLARVRGATPEELAAVPGIGPALAEAVHRALQADESASSAAPGDPRAILGSSTPAREDTTA